MALRLIELVLPSDQAQVVREVLDAHPDTKPIHEKLDDGQVLVRILLEADQTGAVVDELEDRFGHETGFQLLILSVEAALPRREQPKRSEEPSLDEEVPAIARGMSREELYTDIQDMSRLTCVFITTTVLSTVVAAVGVMRDNVAVIIGAMVIAPLLGPNVALAFSTTLGDFKLMREALRANAIGVAVALVIAIFIGIAAPVDPSIDEIASRTQTHWSDIILALAAGSAATLALTTGVAQALVGVMVAVALLPPTVVLGLMIGEGRWSLSIGAGLLVLTNVICINLAGVVTFLAQGVRPLTWWEADRARRATRMAILVWACVLILLLAAILIDWETLVHTLIDGEAE